MPFEQQFTQAQTGTGFSGGAISNLGETIRKAAMVGVERKVQQQSADAYVEGQKAGLVDGDKRAEGFFGRVDRAYNEGLLSTYKIKVEQDLRNGLQTLSDQYSGDAAGFAATSEDFVRGTMDGVDPSFAPEIQLKASFMRDRYKDQVLNNEREMYRKQSFDAHTGQAEELSNEAARLFRIGDSEAAMFAQSEAETVINSMESQGFINQAGAIALKENVRNQGIQSTALFNLKEEYDESGEFSAQEFINESSANPPKGVDQDVWGGVVSKMQAELNRMKAADAAINKVLIKEMEKRVSINNGQDFFDNPLHTPSPEKGGQDRKDVNAYYDNVFEAQNESLPLNERTNNRVKFVKNTGIMPQRLISNMSSTARSGNPVQVSNAAETYRRLQEESPQSLKDLPDETRAIYQQVGSSIDTGIDPDLAVEAARKATYGMTDSEKKNISVQTNANLKALPSKLKDFVGEDFAKGWFEFKPDISNQMQADFNSNYDKFMQYTGGDDDQSSILAWESTKNVWGVTRTGGNKRFMKYAPEVMYNVDGAPKDWIDKQLKSDVLSVGADPDKTIIALDFETARSDAPQYPVLTQNDSGIYVPILDDNNMPLVFQPDFSQSEGYKEMQSELENKKQKAIRKREFKQGRDEYKTRRKIIKHMDNVFWSNIPKDERADWLKTDEGNESLNRAVNFLISQDEIPNDPELILESMRDVFDAADS